MEPSDLVDWAFAARLGASLAKEGPGVSAAEATDAVAELREDAGIASGHVRAFTGLVAPVGTAPVLVVDRPGWIEANVSTFATMIQPVIDKVVSDRNAPKGVVKAVGSKITGAEVGALLAFLSSKVLGQFDPFAGDAGRLLLVAPNVVHVERELRVDPSDFRLWVCLHEETHRVQFTANPWLRDHLLAQIGELAGSMDIAHQLDDVLKRLVEGVRGGAGGGGDGGGKSLIDLVSTPEQQAVIDRVTGVMSLLEGHADVVMDGVGPSVIASVATIRTAFDQRRKGVGVLDRIVRRLMGLDQKMAQYRDGAVFVRHVVDKVGMDGFNAVWSGPETLPGKAEIHDPDLWIKRVC